MEGGGGMREITSGGGKEGEDTIHLQEHRSGYPTITKLHRRIGQLAQLKGRKKWNAVVIDSNFKTGNLNFSYFFKGIFITGLLCFALLLLFPFLEGRGAHKYTHMLRGIVEVSLIFFLCLLFFISLFLYHCFSRFIFLPLSSECLPSGHKVKSMKSEQFQANKQNFLFSFNSLNHC